MDMDYIRNYQLLSIEKLQKLENLKVSYVKDKMYYLLKKVEQKIIEEKAIIRILNILIAADALQYKQVEDKTYEQNRT